MNTPEKAKAAYLAEMARSPFAAVAVAEAADRYSQPQAKLKVQVGDITFEAEGDPTWLINTLEAILDRYDEPETETEGDTDTDG